MLGFRCICNDNVNEYLHILSDIEKLYISAFPNNDEREPFYESIVHNIKENVSFPQKFMVFMDMLGEVCGLMIFDWYEECKSLHITYLAIGERFRKRGYGKMLFENGMKMVSEIIERKTPIQNVFFETDKDDGTPTTANRRRFLSSIGGMVIPFDYRQPPLSKGKQCVECLELCAFNTQYIDYREVLDFIYSFYSALGHEMCYWCVCDSIIGIAGENGKIKLEPLCNATQL